MTNSVEKSGTASGPELTIHLRGRRRRAQLENRLRELVRSGVLASGSRLPSSRALGEDLGVSRRLVVEAYGQLVAEGYLVSRAGAGTYVAAAGSAAGSREEPRDGERLRFDFFPGVPDLMSFPRPLWLRATREVLRVASVASPSYPDPRGAVELRQALAGYLRRVRGVVAEPRSIVICSGVSHGLALLGRALLARGVTAVAVEDPGLPPHTAVLRHAGLRVDPVAVDGDGLDVAALVGSNTAGIRAGGSGRSVRESVMGEGAVEENVVDVQQSSAARAVLCTPAHQFPTGVALSPERRVALVRWADAGGLVIEDDYDAEFRYDRSPLAALQGLAPEKVVYLGTVSKTLAPGLRIGWLALPSSLLDVLVAEKLLDGLGTPTIDQMVLAWMIESAAYDRHLRRVRRRNLARRNALVDAVATSIPGARVTGISAGLHALVWLPHRISAQHLIEVAIERSLGVYPLSMHMADPPAETDALVLGYANLAEPAIAEGIRLLGDVLREVWKGKNSL